MSQQQQQRLPAIEHPLARRSSDAAGSLDVRGTGDPSQPGSTQPQVNGQAGGRPLASEEAPATSRSSRGGSRTSSRRSLRLLTRSEPQALRHQAIPEGVEVVHGQQGKTRLPVFGVRTEAAEAALSRARSSHGSQSARSASSRLSEVQSARLELDEIESLTKEKVRGSYFEMRKRFVDNDPEQKGNVTRDALLRILVTAIGRPVSHSQLSQLFERLGLRKDKQIVNFAEFFAALRDTDSVEYPNWMDPIHRQRQEKAKISAEQAHQNLAERMRQRFVDLADVFPQFVDGGTGRMLKHELRSSLSKMMMEMNDEEFERLWKMYDPKNTGTVSGVAMLRRMGIVMPGKENGGDGGCERKGQGRKHRQPLKAESDRQRSLTIEAWLKDKFREGFQQLKASFEARDVGRTGLVSHDDFLEVLRQHSLHLEKLHLQEFLARCAVPHTKKGVMYRDFLHRFQDRSEAGMTHKIMANPHHAKEEDDVARKLSTMETQLMNMFHRDFLSLLAAFQRIDRHSLGLISQEEFRAVMESRFGFELTDQQFKEFVDQLPLNSDGLVRYDVFMRQFDTKGMAPSLFRSIKDETETEGQEELEEEEAAEEPFDPNKRTVRETMACIREMLATRFQEVEIGFYQLDVFNSGRLTQEMMHQLLKQFISPEVSRGEIRDLWKTFYLRDREALDYQEFLRAFIHHPSTAAFPNAKLFPPKKGDADLMMRSRKINSDVNMLEDNLRAKIDFLWDQLRDEFVAMDPYGTGCVSREEFQEVMKELSVQLTDYELDKVTAKFTRKVDGRVNYVELLRPFAYKKLGPRKNHMNEVLHHPQAALPVSEVTAAPNQAVQQVSAKLRSELAGDWKKLRRQLRKMDAGNTGLIDMPEFRSVLKLFNVVLDEEDVFQLLSAFDKELKGKMPYNRFIAAVQRSGGDSPKSHRAK